MVDLVNTPTALIVLLVVAIVVLSTVALRRQEKISELHKQQLREKDLEVAFQRKALFESGPVSITSQEGHIVEANDKFLETFGFRREDLIGKHISELYPEEEQGLSREIRSTTQSGRIWSGEAHLKRADGSMALTHNTVVPLMDAENNHVKNLSLRIDISQQKMRETQRRVTSAFEKMSDAVLLYDPDSFQIIHMNAFALAEHGWTAEEAQTKSIWETHYITDPALMYETKKLLAENGKCSSRIENADVGKVYDAYSYRVDLASDTHRILTMFREVTQSVELERERNQLISIITHELRTPLTSIKGALGLLDSCAMGPMPSEAKNLVGIALRNSDRMLDLIAQILEAEKVEQEPRDIVLEPLNMAVAVRSAIAANQGYGTELGITYRDPHDTPDLWVHGDNATLEQILANLMSNAAKFSPQGSTVDVWAERDADHVILCVRDFGSGIPKDIQARLFTRFVKANQEVRGNVHGSGLGLSIVKSQVERLGGSIDFETAENLGTCFRVALPLHQDDRDMPDTCKARA